MTSTHKKQNGKVNGSRTNGRTAESESDWRDVTGKFKLAFDQMERDQSANTEKVRRQTEVIKRHASEPVVKAVKR